MEININESISEVLDILEHTDVNIVKKISLNFMNFLQKNKSQEYQVKINYDESDWKEKLNDKTKAILALIYRDYIVEKDEREILIKKEQDEIKRIIKENEEKYSYDNLFKKENKTINEKLKEEAIQETQRALMIIKEEKWYTKIINRIKEFFKIK